MEFIIRFYSRTGAGTSSDAHSYEWVDQTALNGHTYYYKLNTVDVNGNAHTYETVVNATPLAGKAVLLRNSNLSRISPILSTARPASHSRYLKMNLFLSRSMTSWVVKLLQSLIKNMTAKSYNVSWSAKDLATGVYMYTLTAGQNTENKETVVSQVRFLNFIRLRLFDD